MDVGSERYNKEQKMKIAKQTNVSYGAAYKGLYGESESHEKIFCCGGWVNVI